MRMPASPMASDIFQQNIEVERRAVPEVVLMAIEEGLRRQPEWPTLPFAIKKDLYAGQENEWLLQRQWLDDARAKNPKDYSIAFVLAYQMWFDGDRKEAAKLFRQARLLAPDTTFIDLFLKAAPGAVVAAAE